VRSSPAAWLWRDGSREVVAGGRDQEAIGGAGAKRRAEFDGVDHLEARVVVAGSRGRRCAWSSLAAGTRRCAAARERSVAEEQQRGRGVAAARRRRSSSPAAEEKQRGRDQEERRPRKGGVAEGQHGHGDGGAATAEARRIGRGSPTAED
jgi:hypothetical protein